MNGLLVTLSFALAVLLQPKQGQNEGFNLLVPLGNHQCFHVHHWMYLLPMAWYWQFSPWGSIFMGIGLSDIVYTDEFTFVVPC